MPVIGVITELSFQEQVVVEVVPRGTSISRNAIVHGWVPIILQNQKERSHNESSLSGQCYCHR